MSKSHIKINFVGSFTGVPVTSDSTIQDVLDYLLDHHEIPLAYGSLCAILEIRADKFSYPLKPSESVERFMSGNASLHFRVLAIPINFDVGVLDANFLELLYNQVHRLVLNRTWAASDQTVFAAAGYRAGIEFGNFNAAQHKHGMFTKILNQYIPQDIISSMKAKDIEQQILSAWGQISSKNECSNHQLAVRSYLQYVQHNVAQYGCATFIAKLITVNGQKREQYVYFSIRQSGYLIMDAEGCEIAQASFQDAVVTQEGTNMLHVKMLNAFKMEMNGIQAMFDVVEFLKHATLKL